MLQRPKFTPPSDAVVVESESNFVPPSDAVVLKKKEYTESTSTIPENNSESVETIGSLDGVGSNGFPAIDQNLGVPGLKPDLKTVEQLANPPKSKVTIQAEQNNALKYEKFKQFSTLPDEIKKENAQKVEDEANGVGFLNNVVSLGKNAYNTALEGMSNTPMMAGLKQLKVNTEPLADEKKEAKDLMIRQGVKPKDINSTTVLELAKKIKLQKLNDSDVESRKKEFLSDTDIDFEDLKKGANVELSKISNKDKELLKQKAILEPALKDSDDRLNQLNQQLANFKKNNQQPTPEFVDEYNYAIKYHNDILKDVQKTDNQFADNRDKIGDLKTNLDLFKRQYGKVNNFVSNIGATALDLAAGGFGIVDYGFNAAYGALGIDTGPKENSEIVTGLRGASKNIRDRIAKPINIDNIEDAGDFGDWMANTVIANQVPIYGLIATGPGGILALGGSSLGTKYGDMVQEMNPDNPVEGQILKNYSNAELAWKPVGFGIAETASALVDAHIMKGAARVLASATQPERRLISQTIAKRLLDVGGQTIKGGSYEAVDEMATQGVENLIDGKPFTEGMKDAGGAGGAMGALIPFFAGNIAIATKPFSIDNKIQNSAKKTLALEKELANPNLSEDAKKIIQTNFEESKKTTENLLKKKVKDISKMPNENFQEILRIENEQAKLKEKAVEIKTQDGISDNIKKQLLSDFSNKFNELETDRVDILSGKKTMPKIEETNEKPQEVAVTEQIVETQPQAEVPQQAESEKIDVEKTKYRIAELNNELEQNRIRGEKGEISNRSNKEIKAEIAELESKLPKEEVVPTKESNVVEGSVGVGGDVEAKRKETEAKIKRKDLFIGVGEFSSELGGSDKAAVPVSHKEKNGIEFVEYAHPETGSVDVIVTGKSNNDFVGFYRIYENGKPTNKWSSKFENQSRNKEDFKTMISGVQEMLPQGHEYTEKSSISTDGLRVWEQQLSRGYELQYDKNGKLITNLVAINGDAIVNELGIPVQKGEFENIKVKSQEEFEVVKKALLPYLEKLGLGENDIRWLTGTVKINLPVLKSTKETTKAETPTPTQKSNVPVSETKEAQPIEPTKVEELRDSTEISKNQEVPPVVEQTTPDTKEPASEDSPVPSVSDIKERVVYDREPTADDGVYKIIGDQNNIIYRVNPNTGRIQEFSDGFWSNTASNAIARGTARKEGFQKIKDPSINNESTSPTNTSTNGNVQLGTSNVGESGITEQQSPTKESVPSANDVRASEAENEVNLEDIENFINETYLKDEKSSTTTEADQGAVKNSNEENRAIPIGEKGKKQVKVTKEGKVSLQGRKALAKRQFKGDRKTASQIDPTDATSLALRYFVNGGKISSDYFNSQGERQARSNGLHGIAAKEAKTAKGEKATIDAVAHEIWESQENSELKLSTEDIKNAVEEVVNGNLTVQDAVASILGKYNVEEQNDADYEKDYAQAIQEYQQEEDYSQEHIQEVESALDYLSDAEIIELANNQEKEFEDYIKDLESRQVTYDLGPFSEKGTIQPDGWILSENGELLSPQSVRNVKQVNPYIEVGILSEFGNIGKEGVVTLLKAIKAQLSMESGGVGKPFGVNIWTNEQGEIKYVGNNAKRSKGLIQNTFAFDLNDNLLKEKSIINSKEALKAVEEVISNIPEKLEVKTPISKDTPELKEVNSKLEKANEKLRIAKEALDRKAKSLDKELLKDNEDIFGERKTQNENKLFDERVDGNARNKATEKERQAIKDAQKEVKDLTEAKSKIESGEINSTKQMVFDEVDRIAQKIKDILPGIDDPDLKKQGISQDDLIDLVANAVKALVSKGIDINDAIRQVVASIKERFNVEVDEKLVKEKIGVEKPKSKTKNPLREKSSEEIADELGISEKDYLDLKAFVANEPSSGIFNEYLSADTIADVFGDEPTNNQQYEQMVLLNAVQHGNSVLEKARGIFGENYMTKTLEFLQNVKLGNFEKAMVYAALENEIDTLVKSNPSNKVFLATQRLIYSDSQANLRNSSKGLNAGRLRRIHNAIKNGYDVDKVTSGLIKPEQQEAKQILKDAIPTGDNLNKASEQEENTEIEKPRVYTQEEFETELKKAVQATVGKNRNELSKKGKDIADKIRRLKLNKDVARADLSLGTYDLAIEAIAQLVEKGATVAQAIKNVLSDVKYKDIDADKLRQDILGVVNTPRIKDVVKQALIDAGFSREITVTKNAKDANGNDIIDSDGKKQKVKETKEVLDWNKLTGRMNSVEALRSNVEGKLKEQGYTDSQIEEISNELESEYKRLTEYIADKALTELERRNQIPKPVNRKSDLDRLVDYHNKGLFGESAKGYERLINKIVGITKREQDVLDKIEAEIEKIKNLREVKIDGSFPDAQSIESQASYIAKSIRNIIAWSNLVNSPLKLKAITILSDIAGISRAAVLGNLYNAFQNIYSNNRAGFLARMKFKAKGYWTSELNDAFNELKNTVTSDVLLNRGLDFGDTVSPFSNHSIFIEKIKDYINKKYPEGAKRQRAIGVLNTFEGRLFLNVMDSRFKSKIVNIDFVMNLVDVLTSERAGKSKMTKEEAVNFVSESLTGVNLEKAKVLAKKFIDDVNAMKEGTLLKNEDNIKRLAFDIVRENLTSGNNFTMDEINDIYQASMKSGGINIGHESNNIVSEELKSLNNRIEKKVEDAMKEKDFDKATKYATYAFISKNILYPYMSGGLNWAVLEAEAGTPLGLATGAYKSYKNKNIDLLTDVGKKRMKEDLINKRDAESKLFRGIWGTSIAISAYLAYYGLQAVSGVGDDDEENKRISNKYLREHPEQRKIFDKFSPEVYAVSLAVSDERLSKYLLNKMGYKTDKNDNVLTLLKSLQNKNSSTPGALGVLLGQIVSTPGAWRILRDSKRLFRELQGEPMAQTEQRVTSFLNGYFKGALVDYLGLRPGTNYDLEKVKKEIQNKKTDFTNYTNGIANDINSGKITKEDAAKLVNKKYEDNDELLDKAKEIIQNSVNDKEIREGLKDADIWYMEMHNEKDIRAKAYIYYQNELKNNASKTDKNFDKYMDIALYGIDEDYYKKFIDLAIEYKDVEEQKSKKKPVN